VKFFDKFDFIENFFPNTPLAFLIFLFLFFIITTFFILIVAKLMKNEKVTEKNNIQKKLTIDNLIEIAKNQKSTLEDLIFSIKYFNDTFKVKEFPDKAFEFFKLLLSNKNRKKILFDIFHNETIKLNKDFEEQLNKIEKECLNK
jgi:hypothetical protein